MPLPKRKTSKWSRNQRRHSNWRAVAPNISSCPRCHAARLSYHACPSCGFYNGRKVLDIKQERTA